MSVPIKMLVIKFPIKARHGEIEINGVKIPTPFCGQCSLRFPQAVNFVCVNGTCFCQDCLTKHFNKEESKCTCPPETNNGDPLMTKEKTIARHKNLIKGYENDIVYYKQIIEIYNKHVKDAKKKISQHEQDIKDLEEKGLDKDLQEDK